MRRKIGLLKSNLAGSPLVLGVFRSSLVVPAFLISGLSTDQWEAILAHELAHIRRHDFVLNLLQITIETLLFYHPAVWWISKQTRVDREHCCDDIAAQLCTPIALAEGLATIESYRSEKIAALSMAAIGDGRSNRTLTRIQRLLDFNSTVAKDRRGSWMAGLLVGLLVAVIVLFGLVERLETTSNTTNAAVDEPAPDSWEISKIYGETWLGAYFGRHEVLPRPIVVPPVRGQVVDAKGRPVENASVVSHTPRHGLRLRDGKWFATGSQNSSTFVFHVQTVKFLFALENKTPDNQVACLEFSPDGKQLAIGDLFGVTLVDAGTVDYCTESMRHSASTCTSYHAERIDHEPNASECRMTRP
jgi:hypothetical protein